MSAEQKDGGSAFPYMPEQRRQVAAGIEQVIPGHQPGMTLRDYFAAQFMVRAQSLCETNDGWEMHNAAQCAYAMADAMLQARSS